MLEGRPPTVGYCQASPASRQAPSRGALQPHVLILAKEHALRYASDRALHVHWRKLGKHSTRTNGEKRAKEAIGEMANGGQAPRLTFQRVYASLCYRHIHTCAHGEHRHVHAHTHTHTHVLVPYTCTFTHKAHTCKHMHTHIRAHAHTHIRAHAQDHVCVHGPVMLSARPAAREGLFSREVP